MKKNNQSESANLRQQAEELLSMNVKKTIGQLSEAEIYKLIHELQVHQIELELQNKELIQAKEQATIASEKYIELYDFSPTGYFTLSRKGEILQLNLSGAKMLGKDRSQPQNRLFHLFVTDYSKPIFRLFLEKVFSSNVKENCELALLTSENLQQYIYLTGILSDNGDQCYITATDVTERKQSESELRTSNELNKTLLQTIPFGMDIVDEKGNILFVSEGLQQHFGAGALGKKCWELYRDDQKQCDDCPLHAGIKVGLTEIYEAHGVLGEKIFEVSHTGMIYNGQKAMLEIFIDITERKHLEDNLLKSRTLLTETEKTGKIGGWTFNVDTLTQIWTDEIFNILEIDTTNGAPMVPQGLEFIDEPYRQMAELAIQRAIEYGESYDQEWMVTTDNGNKRWVHSVGRVNQVLGKTISLSGSFQDITERKLAEEKLQTSERKFRAVAELSPMAIYASSGTDQKAVYINEAFYKIFGFSMEDVPTVGQWWIKAFPDERYRQQIFDQWVNNIEQANKSNTDVEALECICTCKDGSEKNIVWVGKTIGDVFWAFGYDFTEQRLVEIDLILAKEHAEESDRLKSAFLANMSHEIRTPMNGILGFSELLKEPDLTGEKQQEYIQIIQRSGNRMLNIINDIVDISKIESGQMKVSVSETNVSEQMEFIYKFFQTELEQKGINLSLKNSLSSSEALITTDREKLYSILTNLVKNAIKFTKEGSIEFGVSTSVTMSLSNCSTTGSVSEPEVTEHSRSIELLQFYVKDTGIGIPLDRQEAIFERFIQADIADKMARQGAGLGLAISRAYVQMLGGEIWVESEEGKGSTFYFTLPYHVKLNKKNDFQNIDDSKANENKINNLKILIAEDDESSSQLISIGVQKFGKEIITVQTGTEAVEACLNHPDFDLILMDIQMPQMDGYEATRQIRQFNSDVIIVAQTAYALAGDREKALVAGCTDYISKPIKRIELMQLMQKYFINMKD